tara:strand:- start:1133 stop:2377 length:1245 start_codon:yes stop_codon:yes gene_type:complete
MSNLLKEAIVDAKALRESALKNAETIVIEKYSEEVKDTLQKLLEQEDDLGLALPGEEEPAADAGADSLAADPLAAEEPALDAAPAEEEPLGAEAAPEEDGLADEDIPLGATDDFANLDGQNLGDFAGEGEGQQLTIDLGALQESIEALKQSIDEDEEVDLSEFINEEEDEELNEEDAVEAADETIEAAEEELAEEMDDGEDDLEDKAAEAAAGSALDGIMSAMSEDVDADDLVEKIMEKLTVDMGADLAGWAGRSQEDKKYQMEKEMAHRRSTDVEEELETLKKAQEELVFENNQLTEKLSDYEAVLSELKEGLQDTNLSNARLLYTNRVLRNTSLNERQKDKIAEAISNAGSVTEAKTIYDTLQSTVEAKPQRSPKSLSEAIGRRNTVLRATRQEAPASDPFQDRMKRLAGIK